MLSDYIKLKFLSNLNTGVMVEVGAAGPEFLYQSKPFRSIGWRCICVEPNPKFVKLHKDVGNEIYEYACSDENLENVNFEIVDVSNGEITNESFSSLVVSEKLCEISGYTGGKNSLNIQNISVNVRKLDTILEEAKILKVDYVIVDVEGWELNVMKGFTTSKYQPRVIVLESAFANAYQMYHDYMSSLGYEFDSFDNTTGPNLVYYNKNY